MLSLRTGSFRGLPLLLAFCALGWSQKFNINTADYDQLSELPITAEQQAALDDYLYVHGSLTTIYDLLNVDGFSAEDVMMLKPLVTVETPELSSFLAARRSGSYKLERWLTAEGNTEGLSEVWLDRYYEPSDVNRMNYDDLMAMPQLSPIDAVAVIKQQARGEIKGTFELRNAPGMSNYGYRNLRDFIRYDTDDDAAPEFHARFTSLVRNIPITNNPDEDGTIIALEDPSRPEQFRKLSVTYGEHVKLGHVFHKYMGDPEGIYSDKRFVSLEGISLGRWRLDRLVLGNFTAAFGQSVVMETTDHFSPRRSGYGFTKRAEGIYPDLTRSTQYVMDGLAVQMSSPKWRTAFFISKQPRDAVINADSSFSTLIVMTPRLPWGVDPVPPPEYPGDNAPADELAQYYEDYDQWADTTKIHNELTNSVEEVTWGGNLRFTPKTGLNIGLTFYESLYDRVLDPQIIETITGGDDDRDAGFVDSGDGNDFDDYSGDAFFLNYMTNTADPEVAAMYASEGSSDLWDDARSYRRVYGVDFTYVTGNMAFQGEYGRISSSPGLFTYQDEPQALVLNAYTQFDNFNFLAVYRDYDLTYDNPYQRSFSNYQRFKTSILEDTYWLENEVYGFLYSGNPQPQSEKGLFLSSRYQFHRSFVGTLNWDTWTRKADEARYFRTVATIDWRPVFNYRFNIRQKWQARGSHDIFHPSPFYSRETRVRVRIRLSSYDQVELLYSNGYTTFSPRPRLTGNPYRELDMVVGDVGTPDESMGLGLEHNFDQFLKMKVGVLYIKGFLWNFEDTDFMIYNTESGMIRNWLSFHFNPSGNLTVRLKISRTSEYPFGRTVSGESPSGIWISNPVENREWTNFRFQIDYGI